MHQPKTWLQDALIPPEPDGHFVMIPLSQGKFALVDEGDAERILSMGSWYAARTARTWYARGGGRGRPRTLMHAVIAGIKGPDHVNGNGLDNRRANLRPATHAQNCANHAPYSNNTSGYKGVSWQRSVRKWKAEIGVNGRRIYLGLFNDPAEGARAYNRAALEYFGEFARLNPLPLDDRSPAALRQTSRRRLPRPGREPVRLRELGQLPDELQDIRPDLACRGPGRLAARELLASGLRAVGDPGEQLVRGVRVLPPGARDHGGVDWQGGGAGCGHGDLLLTREAPRPGWAAALVLALNVGARAPPVKRAGQPGVRPTSELQRRPGPGRGTVARSAR